VRDNDGRKLDHKTLEALRIRAVGQVEEGAHPEDVAAALGMHRKTVYDWLAKYREGGKDAPRARPVGAETWATWADALRDAVGSRSRERCLAGRSGSGWGAMIFGLWA
jgi:transposase-like protein